MKKKSRLPNNEQNIPSVKMEKWQCSICEDLKNPCIFTTEVGMTSIPTGCPFDTGCESEWKEIVQ